MGFSAGRLARVYKTLGADIVGIEIGVCRGENILELMRNCPNIKKMYGVDPWKAYAINKLNRPPNFQTITQEDCDEWHLTALEILVPYLKNNQVELVRKQSLEAVKQFSDDFFDFVFIDGDHSYLAVLADLEAWWPKVKPGKIFSGHDFRPRDVDVRKAVYDFAAKHGVAVNEPINDSPNFGPCWYIKKPEVK
jgi:hypothetical protein